MLPVLHGANDLFELVSILGELYVVGRSRLSD